MITSFEVGAIFRIVNEASPALRKILAQVRTLQAAIDKARASLDLVAKPAGLTAAIAETGDLAKAWGDVAKNAGSARLAIGRASSASVRPLIAGAGSVALPGGGRQMLGRRLHGGGGGGHISGPGIGLPGGGHMRFGGGAGLAALGLLGYGIDQAMNYDDAAVLMANIAGVDLDLNRAKFVKTLKDAAIATGYGEHDIAEATKTELRMFGDTGGSNGINILPKMLRYAATEARLKGTSLEESMSSMTGLAHMLQRYSESDVDKIAPAFSALSIRNPMTLAQQEKAFGYAVPLLHAAMGLDPFQTMAASTALARAGISSTKAGTWIRQMMKGAMPGTSIMTKTMFRKHESALRELGLVDDADKPTWFTGGKPDEMKFLETVSENLPKIDITRRAALLQSLAGTQGAGALAVLAEPAVQQQMKAMYAETQNPANVNRFRNFLSVYNSQSSLQNARTAFQEMSVTLADIGQTVLPALNGELKDFKAVLQGIRSVLPGPVPGNIGTRAAEGATLGAIGGAFVAGPVGAAIGGVGGGVAGVAEAYMEQQSRETAKKQAEIDKGATPSQVQIGKQVTEALKAGAMPPINFSLNIDGRSLAEAVLRPIGQAAQYEMGPPAYDGSQP